MPLPRLLPCLAVLVLAGCDLVGVDCTTSVEPGIVLELYDAQTTAPITAGAEAELRDGAYIEVLAQSAEEGEASNEMPGAWERPGTYDITVEHPDYAIWTREDVLIRAGQCHVITRTIRADLTPAEPIDPQSRG